ncbi:MAG: hypothetical protein ACT4OX_10985 [Actinomycetota bacterium]
MDLRPFETLLFNSFFFEATRLDFDVDPRELISRSSGDELLDFMRLIGREFERLVKLTPEGDATIVLLRYEPSSDNFEVGPFHDRT